METKNLFLKICLYIIIALATAWALVNLFLFIGNSVFLEEELSSFFSSARYARMEHLLYYSYILLVLVVSLKLTQLVSPVVFNSINILEEYVNSEKKKQSLK